MGKSADQPCPSAGGKKFKRRRRGGSPHQRKKDGEEGSGVGKHLETEKFTKPREDISGEVCLNLKLFWKQAGGDERKISRKMRKERIPGKGKQLSKSGTLLRDHV